MSAKILVLLYLAVVTFEASAVAEQTEGPPGAYDDDCYEEEDKGQDSYTGTLSQTISGKTCQYWDSQSPHKHRAIYNGEQNYCRNPMGDVVSPWCYTTDAGTRWEFCDVPVCKRPRGDCYYKDNKEQHLYVGNMSRTETGKICQRWDRQSPHKHHAKYMGPENHCYNPIADEPKPWCYTTDPKSRWEYCDVPMCTYPRADCYYESDKGQYYYKGVVSKTVSGRTCQRWDSQSPHSHEADKMGPANHCRNPIDGALRPWCYTTDPEKRWEYCDVPAC